MTKIGAISEALNSTSISDITVDELPTKLRYQYSPLLTGTSIRLLQTHGKDKSGILQCSLKIVDLNDEPKYHALSYTWGNPHANGTHFQEYYKAVAPEYVAETTILILCDGKAIRVQQNLYDALTLIPQDLSARRANQETFPRLMEDSNPSRVVVDTDSPDSWIWIDAICIDQNNIPERGAQVSIMDLIYQKASYTIIWLGREDIYTATAAQTVSKLASANPDDIANSDILPYLPQPSEVYERANVPFIAVDEWKALAAIFQRQWFKRLWIVQETILSKQLLVYCGPHEFYWNDLAIIAQALCARYEALGYPTCATFILPEDAAVGIEFNLVKLLQWREASATHSSTLSSLESLLYDTWTFSATDPRDKIYGLYGLLALYQPHTRSTWIPDYSKSISQCFAETIKRIIQETGDLRILSTIHDATVRRLPSLPTWVPDLSVPYVNMMASIYSAAGSTPLSILPSPPPSSLSPTWSRLYLSAAKLDTITTVSKSRAKHLNAMMELDPSWFELTLLLSAPYPATNEPRTTVLWRTLIANLDAHETHPAPVSFAILFRELVCAMICRRAVEEADSARAGQGGAPSLAAAIASVRAMWEDDHLRDMSAEDIYTSFKTEEHVLRGPHQQGLVYTLFKLHVLSLTEPNSSTPSLHQIAQFTAKPTYRMWDQLGRLQMPPDPGFVHSFQRKYGRRRLFVTRKGYLGLGPASVRVGDEVWVLGGAGAAFVLRGVGEGDGGVGDEKGKGNVAVRSVVGEAYVHGIMGGEAVEKGEVVFGDLELV
ncbi:hypothetical protein K432DRAFT_394682 [Lepidopterella palustris CBS 459.81]|uniref:Heterokaryon incompatibility domain-containing protein n=1 Tax=Lepidopterella palustris CBS 459.81 TaxID=1314670 RepID=A0A8E2JDI6_9PEZI|nr:hypothetical protein K432DRAFT_394682 [Lepidopterella palustris CBS 459.81]